MTDEQRRMWGKEIRVNAAAAKLPKDWEYLATERKPGLRELSTMEIYWMQAAALGPLSYICGPGDKRTHADNVTVQASTYNAMMRYGWVSEVIS